MRTPAPRWSRWPWSSLPGVSASRWQEIFGLDVGDSEDEVLWRGFLTSLRQRGLAAVRVVISDQHAGLVAALRRASQGAGEGHAAQLGDERERR